MSKDVAAVISIDYSYRNKRKKQTILKKKENKSKLVSTVQRIEF